MGVELNSNTNKGLLCVMYYVLLLLFYNFNTNNKFIIPKSQLYKIKIR